MFVTFVDLFVSVSIECKTHKILKPCGLKASNFVVSCLSRLCSHDVKHLNGKHAVKKAQTHKFLLKAA